MTSTPSSTAGGAPIAFGAMIGAAVGFGFGQATAGFLIGLGIGVGIAVAVWLRGR